MSAPVKDSFAPLVEQLVAGELPPKKRQTVHAHVKECESCRGIYNRLVLAERMLHGGPKAAGQLSPFEIDHVANLLFDEAASETVPVGQRIRAWFSMPKLATALGVAAMLVAAPFLLKRPAPEFQSRGNSSAAVRSASLRAFCLSPSGIAALTVDGRCGLGDQLKLAVSNAGKFSHLFVVGMEEDHQPRWYAPIPPETVSIALASTPGDIPVGGSVQISVNHQAGPLRIFGLFSDQPVQASEVESALTTLDHEHRGPKETTELPLSRSDITQKSILVEITP